MTVTDGPAYDTRRAYATVSDEEPLRTPRGTRPIDGFSISLEWTHGKTEPHLTVVGLPLFVRKATGGSDYVTRNFAPGDYAATGAALPQWIIDFYRRHDPNAQMLRTWRRGDPEPPGDVVVLSTTNLVEGARYLHRTPEGGWWFVDFPTEAPDPEGFPWSLVWSDDSDPGTLTEVPL